LGAGRLGGQPPLLEYLADPLLHGRGDVAVDAAHAGEAVAQTLGLSALGDVVLDEPRLVGMPASRSPGMNG